MKFLDNAYFHLIARVLLGLLFLYAGVGKIGDQFGFAVDIYNFKLFPELMIGISAAFIPWLEAITGAFLILGVSVRGASLLIAALLISFIVLIGISAIRGLDLECGCFSGVERKVGFIAVGEDVIMLIWALVVLFCDKIRLSPNHLVFTSKSVDRSERLLKTAGIIVVIIFSLSAFGFANNSDQGGRQMPVDQITVQELNAWINQGKKLIIIDISTVGEFREGHIKGSIHLDKQQMWEAPKSLVNNISAGKDDTLVFVCQTGNLSRKATMIFKNEGLNNCFNLEGGKLAWLRAGYHLTEGDI